MTVAELIEALKDFPQDAEVISVVEPAVGFRGYTDAKPSWAKVRRYRRGFGWVLHPRGRLKVCV